MQVPFDVAAPVGCDRIVTRFEDGLIVGEAVIAVIALVTILGHLEGMAVGILGIFVGAPSDRCSWYWSRPRQNSQLQVAHNMPLGRPKST